MSGPSRKTFLTAILAASFALGYLTANIYNHLESNRLEQKPVLGVEEKSNLVSDSTQIVFEQEYECCGHVIISEFEWQEELLGKNVDQIKKMYTKENGFTVIKQGDTLVIRQIVDDWCPTDKGKYRLKEYKGFVAIYQGPTYDTDVLTRVTNINLNYLPPGEQEKIKNGEYEFQSTEELNDALENLDEYI